MKKGIRYLIYLFIFAIVPISVLADGYSYRGKEMNIVYIVGMALLVIRIVVPILLIVTSMIDLTQTMTHSDASISSGLKKLGLKIVIAIIIFLLPSFLAFVLKTTSKSSLWSEYSSCLSSPSRCKTNLWEEPTNIQSSSKGGTTVIGPEPGLSDGKEMVEYAMQFKNKDVGTDCSGFVKKVLKKFNHLDSGVASTSGYCDGKSRGSYGMYLYYKKNGQLVWERSSSARTVSEAVQTFPGNCQPGDVIFYTYGAGSSVNDCVKHVVIYVGYENGKPMILDSNTQDHVVRYRGVGDVWWAAIPLACARP